jgi:hypothetical protein
MVMFTTSFGFLHSCETELRNVFQGSRAWLSFGSKREGQFSSWNLRPIAVLFARGRNIPPDQGVFAKALHFEAAGKRTPERVPKRRDKEF